MLNAARLKDRAATIEHAKLLWQDGHHRKAIQTLEGAIAASEITPAGSNSVDSDSASFASGRGHKQNDVSARVREFFSTFACDRLTLSRPISC